jgi:hypothetical protein
MYNITTTWLHTTLVLHRQYGTATTIELFYRTQVQLCTKMVLLGYVFL